MRRWRVPLILSAIVVVAQLVPTSPLVDVVTGATPADVRLAWPVAHIVFAPFTLLADWLNGGSTADLIGFAVWALAIYIGARLSAGPDAQTHRRTVREAVSGVVFLLAFAAFLAWGTLAPRPIPRLVASDSALVIFDTHSHTSLSHDGRKGFSAATNAAWHTRAGFDAAFITDHNVFAPGRAPRMLNGEELSLNGLHMVMLGNDSLVKNKPWDASFDSSLILLGRLLHQPPATSHQPFLIASLPEYWRNHWGLDVGRVVAAGTRGLEIWTTSPKAMDFPANRRREVIARARSLDLAMFGATDMHGLGYAATVWNVIALPGWRALDDAALTRALLEAFRAEPGSVRVIVLRRRIAPTRPAQIIGMPLGAVTVLRGASPGHAVALLGWIWAVAVLRRRLTADS
jgi:hypothetical protein